MRHRIETAGGGGTVRQVVSPGGRARPATRGGGVHAAGRFWPGESHADIDPSASTRLVVDEQGARWADVRVSQPAAVTASWRGRFSFTAPGDASATDPPRFGDGTDRGPVGDGTGAPVTGGGLRVAQSGALHAVLA